MDIPTFVLFAVGLVVGGLALGHAKGNGMWFLLLALLFLGAAVAVGVL